MNPTPNEERIIAEVSVVEHLLASVVAHSPDRDHILTRFQLRISALVDLQRIAVKEAQRQGIPMSAEIIPAMERSAAAVVKMIEEFGTGSWQVPGR